MIQDFEKLIHGNVNEHFNMWAALHSLNSITGLLGRIVSTSHDILGFIGEGRKGD